MTAAITHEHLSVEAGALPLTIARATGNGALVVIVPSAFGIGPDLEEQMAELATEARAVVAIDPFFRDDPGLIPYEDRARLTARMQSFDRERAYRDLRAAIGRVREQERGRAVVIVGICFGGALALRAAADGSADGVVTWHGTRMEGELVRAAEMRCPMRLHFGSRDPFVPASAVESVGRAFSGRPDVQVVVHEGATHGYSHRAAPQAYDARAERAGMEAVLELIAAARY